MSKKRTHPIDIKEVESLSDEFTVEKIQHGVYLVEDFLFVWPKNQKWGERYKQAYGYYKRGHLRSTVNKIIYGYDFSETKIYKKGGLAVEEL